MSIEQARAHLARFGADGRIVELDQSSATVEKAAAALGVEPARIAKTIAVQTKAGPAVIVDAGDARINNRAFKDFFGEKLRMIPGEKTESLVGHPPGGVCPFGVAEGVRIYLDESLRRFETVYPACGSQNSAIGLSPAELEEFTSPDGWVDLSTPLNRT
ncbi:MAG: YbaK/EbsC family protein [Clostridia bacterium]|nr:YbaK/EbsC family protein [Clostridia bacterium]